ncbi:4969_t:CDS:1 [Funneliformis geosporum]|uniref:6136_t:CDS:1 n=1 Tax=Funneliformis geosporum TaxID=1117311 RepID=A0A9W4WYA5_9GLOM|nr:4969_t:CDS:1 [Funneliformis geosporum]CAI2172630.1 6136_t:CDS:1 [Funneliformis geosporum]
MALYLPPETLQKIFSYISDDDFDTLHSLILVNREWCQNSIMLLWKTPFINKLRLKNNYKIISVILAFLDDERKHYLNITDASLEIQAKVLFDYPSFIKELHFEAIMFLIKEWIKRKEEIRPNLDYDYFFTHEKEYIAKFNAYKYSGVITPNALFKNQERIAFVDAIYHVISRNNNALKSLILDKPQMVMYEMFKPFYQEIISSNPSFLNRLELIDFYYDMNFPEILIEFSKIAHNLKSIHIGFHYDMSNCNGEDGLIQLIKSQNNLEHVALDGYEGSRLADIHNALITQAHSLKTFKIWFTEIDLGSLNFLGEFQNLEELEFGCIDFYSVYENNFPKLKKLKIYDPYFIDHEINYSIPLSIITNVGKYLSKFVFMMDFENSLSVIQTIATYCPNLVSLTFRIQSREELDELVKYFDDKFQKLEVLKCCNYFADQDEYWVINGCITEFFLKIPKNIRKLDISKWVINIKLLEDYLHCIKKPLKIFQFTFHGEIHEIRNLVKKFAIEKNWTIKGIAPKSKFYYGHLVKIEWD